MKIRYILFLGAGLLGGCAGEVEMRSVAGQSAAILTQYRTSVRDFAAGQTALNASNVRRLDQLRRQRADRDAEVANRRDSWTLSGNGQALRRHSVATRVRADEIVARLVPPVETAPPEGLKYDAGAVDTILKQLVQLRTPTGPEQRLRGLIAFGTALRQRYREDIAGASAEASETTGQTSDSVSDLTAENVSVGPERPSAEETDE